MRRGRVHSGCRTDSRLFAYSWVRSAQRRSSRAISVRSAEVRPRDRAYLQALITMSLALLQRSRRLIVILPLARGPSAFTTASRFGGFRAWLILSAAIPRGRSACSATPAMIPVSMSRAASALPWLCSWRGIRFQRGEGLAGRRWVEFVEDALQGTNARR